MEKEIAELKQKIAALEEWRDDIIAEMSSLPSSDWASTLDLRVEALESKIAEQGEDSEF